jgi:hypothetical protein
MDVPALRVVVDALAGEFGHAPLKRGPGVCANCLDIVVGAAELHRELRHRIIATIGISKRYNRVQHVESDGRFERSTSWRPGRSIIGNVVSLKFYLK